VPKVLIVEDEESVRHALVKILENFGHKVQTAADAPEGLKKFEEGADIVITDLGLPGPSGWDLARAIKEKDPKVPVVLLSGWDVETEDKSLTGLVEKILSKPVKIKEMLDTIDQLARKPEAKV
jgi:CheY-like chemotaxis protein